MTPHIKHLLIAALVAVVVLGSVWKVLAHMDGKAHDEVTLAQQTLKEDLEKAKLQAFATASDKQALQGQLNALAASNDALRRDLATLRSQLANQRQANDAMAPSDLSAHWGELINMPGQIQPAPGGFNVTLAAGHATVNQLEEIPVLKAEKQKLVDNSAEKDKTLAQAKKTLESTEVELATCKKTVKDADDLCKKQVAEVKASGRKRNLVVAVLAAIGGVLIRGKI